MCRLVWQRGSSARRNARLLRALAEERNIVQPQTYRSVWRFYAGVRGLLSFNARSSQHPRQRCRRAKRPNRFQIPSGNRFSLIGTFCSPFQLPEMVVARPLQKKSPISSESVLVKKVMNSYSQSELQRTWSGAMASGKALADVCRRNGFDAMLCLLSLQPLAVSLR